VRAMCESLVCVYDVGGVGVSNLPYRGGPSRVEDAVVEKGGHRILRESV
jgi:hypothetical protein